MSKYIGFAFITLYLTFTNLKRILKLKLYHKMSPDMNLWIGISTRRVRGMASKYV